MGLNNQNLHNFLFHGILTPWEAYTGAKIKWIDLAQADYNARVRQSIATGAAGPANPRLGHARPVRHHPQEMEQAALVDGCSIWGAFLPIVLPMASPGMVAAFILSPVLCWNEYIFASLLTGFDAQTLPVMVASQTGSQGINWWTIAALAMAAIAPLLLIGIFLERYIMGLTAGAGK